MVVLEAERMAIPRAEDVPRMEGAAPMTEVVTSFETEKGVAILERKDVPDMEGMADEGRTTAVDKRSRLSSQYFIFPLRLRQRGERSLTGRTPISSER